MHCPDVCAVVVTYRYPYEQLEELLEILDAALGQVFLVDNNPRPDAAGLDNLRRRFERCTVLPNHANLGLSKALNRGIEQALGQGFPWLLLFDQDSRPTPPMLQRLLAVRSQVDAAAMGPSIYDERLGTALPFLSFHWGGVRRHWPDPKHHRLIDTDILITSGSLLNARALRDIGLMDEDLFIDGIDLEWCFRAKARGYRLIGVSDAVLRHRLGDAVRHHPRLGKRVLIHSPQRQYHIIRNRVLLYRRGYVPLRWKLADFPRLVFNLLYFSLFVPPRRENFLEMMRGLRAGVFR
jgi:rhamnosyltransferase